MKHLPSVGYDKIVAKLRMDGWIIVGRKGNQLRLHKRQNSEVFKITVPTHRPVKKTTLDHIIRISNISFDNLVE